MPTLAELQKKYGKKEPLINEKSEEVVNESESQKAIVECIPEISKRSKRTPESIKAKKRAISKSDNLDSYTLLYLSDLIDYGFNTIRNKPVVKKYRSLIAKNQKAPEELIEKKYVKMYIKGKKAKRYIRDFEGIH